MPKIPYVSNNHNYNYNFKFQNIEHYTKMCVVLVMNTDVLIIKNV